jgi:hypothetical protein
MITIVNNCLQFVELAQLMKQHYWRPGLHDNEAGTKFEALLNTFQVNKGPTNCFMEEILIQNFMLGFYLKMTVFWDFAPCSLLCSHPDDGGRKRL